MSQNNNDNSGFALVIAVVGAMAFMMVVLAYFAVMFIAFVLSIVSLFAWNSPVIIGKWTVTPDAARSFVYRGLAGAVLLPAFVIFLIIVFGIERTR